jgi:hypothetical protein
MVAVCTVHNFAEAAFHGRDSRFHQKAGAPASTVSLELVRLGSVGQDFTIRDHFVSNPVLLYFLGGPGTSELCMLRQHNMPTLEKYFTVAVWDLHGAGLSYAARKLESGTTIAQFIADAHALVLPLFVRPAASTHRVYQPLDPEHRRRRPSICPCQGGSDKPQRASFGTHFPLTQKAHWLLFGAPINLSPTCDRLKGNQWKGFDRYLQSEIGLSLADALIKCSLSTSRGDQVRPDPRLTTIVYCYLESTGGSRETSMD